MSRFPYHTLLPLPLLAVCAIMLSAQKPTTTSVDARVVNVLVTVRDQQGKFVNNLTQNDFTLDEDGEPQTIKYFGRNAELPLTLGLLVDTSARQRRELDKERSASNTFVDQFLRDDKDKAFLIHFDREVELLQDLTPSRQKLESGLQLLKSAAPDQDRSLGGGYPRGGGYPGGGYPGGGGPSGTDSRHRGGNVFYDGVFLSADEVLQKQHGRKALIVLTDGVDRGSKTSLERAIESAQRADAVVYAILLADHDADDRRSDWNTGGGMNGPWGRRPGGVDYPRRPEPQEEHVDGKAILQRFSQETGGRMFEVLKKQPLDQIYKEIQDELRNQYSLGYTPDHSDDSDYHRIHLRAKQQGLVVQVRDGYYSPTAAAPKKAEKDKAPD